MIAYYLQVMLCMAVFYGFYHIALRRETLFRSNRTYLIITLIASFILPLVSVYIESRQDRTLLVEAPLYVGAYVQSMGEEIRVTPAAASIPWLTIAGWAYVAVVCYLLLKMGCSILHILRIKNRGEVRMLASHNCIVSPEIKCPFSFFNAIYIPSDHGFSETELEEVLRHEHAHVTGNHTLDVLLVEFACIVMWLNPFVYLYRKSLKDLHEFMADHAVIEKTPWDTYAQLLIANKDNSFQTRLSNHLIFSQLKKRLLMMNKQRTGITGRMKYIGIVPVLMIALVLFSFRQREHAEQTDIHSQVHVNESPNPVLYMTAGKRYFLDGKELQHAELPAAITSVTNGKSEKIVALVFDEGMTVADLADILDIGYRQQIKMVLNTGEEWEEYKQNMENRIAGSNDQAAGETKVYDLYKDGLKIHRLDPMTGTLSPWTQKDAKLDPLEMDQPIFPGCENLSTDEQLKCSTEKLYAYISANLVYPESLKKSGIEGKVFAKFVVGANGLIKDIIIQRSLSPDADKAVTELIAGMNEKAGKWQPAIKDGKAVDAEIILPVSFVMGPKPAEEVYQYAEEMPYMKGCEHIAEPGARKQCATGLMYQFIGDHLVYPKEDKENGLEGNVIAQFTIDTDGKMKDIQVVRTKSETMTAEVIRVLNSMAAAVTWNPAMDKGKPVPLRFTIPVKFVLQKEMNEKSNDVESEAVTVVTQTVDQQIVITPNPANTSIEVPLFEGAHTVIIVNAEGKQVINQRVRDESAATINIAALPAGRYYVQVLSNTKVKDGPFIKQ